MSEWHDPRHKVCAVCASVLDHRVPNDRSEPYWAHNLAVPDDHPAVPVDADEIHVEWRCDFCYAPELDYTVPARDFSIPELPDTGSIGDWGACEACAELIRRDQWSALVRRVTASWYARRGEPMAPGTEAFLNRSYRLLRKNIIGPVRVADKPTKES